MTSPPLKYPLLVCSMTGFFSCSVFAEEMVPSVPKTQAGALWVDGACVITNPCQITNLAELRWLSETKAAWDEHYVQTSDIDASETTSWNGGKGFEPIASGSEFLGTYNGGGFTISKLYINRPDEHRDVGLFAKVKGNHISVQKLGLVDVDIQGGTYNVGALVGYASYSANYLSEVYSSGSVKGGYYVGGLVGWAEGWITNSYSLASVTSSKGMAGGLSGHITNGIKSSFFAGDVSGPNQVGTLSGWISSYGDPDFDVIDSYYDQDTFGMIPEFDHGIAKSTVDMKQKETYVNWDFRNVWMIKDSYPQHTDNAPPVAIDQLEVFTEEDTLAYIHLDGTDSDGDVLTYSISTQPSSGILSLDGTLATYTPNLDFSKEDSFQFVVNDGTIDSYPGTVNIDVKPVNDAPKFITETWLSGYSTPIYSDSYQVDKYYAFTSEEGYPAVIAISTDGQINVQFLIEDSWVTQNELTLYTDMYHQGTFDFSVDDIGRYHYSLINSDNEIEYGVSSDTGWLRSETKFIASGDYPVASIDTYNGKLYLAYFPEYNKVAVKQFDGDWSDAAEERYISNTSGIETYAGYHLDLNLSPTGDLHLGILHEYKYDDEATFLYSYIDATWSEKHIFSGSNISEMVVFSNNSIVMTVESGNPDSPLIEMRTIRQSGMSGSSISNAHSPYLSTVDGGDVYFSYVSQSDQSGRVTKWSKESNGFNKFTNSTIKLETNELDSEIHLFSSNDGKLYATTSNNIILGDLLTSKFEVNDWLGESLSFSEDSEVSKIISEDLTVKDPDSFYELGEGLLIHDDTSSGNLTIPQLNFVDMKVRFLEENGKNKKEVTITGDLDDVVEAIKSAVYRPALNFYGQSTVKISVKDNHAEKSDTGTITLNVTPIDDEPIGRSGVMTTAEDTPSELDLSTLVVELDGDALKYSVIQPQNGVVELEGSVVKYQPSSDFYGVDSFNYTVFDGVDSFNTLVTKTISVTVENVNDAPVISGTPSTSVKQDEAYNFVPTVTDKDEADTYTFSITGKPAWAAFDASTGALTGTPSNDDVISASGIVITVTDSGEPALSASLPAFQITIENVNDAPVISGTPSTSVKQDEAYNFVPTVTDKDEADTHTFSITGKPAWAAFDASTGALTGTPSNDDVISASGIVITVTDSGEPALSASLPAFQITIENANDAPVISGTPSTSVKQDEAYNFVPTVTDKDEADTHTFSITGKPAWAVFDASTGALTGTPTYEEITEYVDIIISVSDGELEASLPSFNIDVTLADFELVNDTVNEILNDNNVYLFDVLLNDIYPLGSQPKIVAAASDFGMVTIRDNQLELTLEAAVTTVTLQYYVEIEETGNANHETLKDDALVIVTLDRSEENEQPVINVPEDIDVRASALFTRVDLGIATAIDSLGNDVAVSLVDGVTLFAPGKNTVYWKAVDEQGNEALESQLVHVHPLVSLPQNAVIEAGHHSYVVEVILNGEAPEYPVSISYRLNNELQPDLIINEGTIGVIELLSSDLVLSEEMGPNVVIELDESENIGQNARFELTVQPQPIAPEVSSIVMQKGEKRQVVEALTPVDITVAIDNALPGSHYEYLWSVNGVSGYGYSEGFSYIPELEEGTTAKFDEISVAVIYGELITEHQIFIEVHQQLKILEPLLDTDGDLIPDSEEGYADSDKDGIPDYQDGISECNVMQERASKSDGYLVEAEPGLCLRMGITVANNYHGGVQLDTAHDGLVEDLQKPNVGGVFDFVITGLKQPGDFANIVIPQVNSIPMNAQYMKYDVVSEKWYPFNVDSDSGYLSSAQGEPGYCPPPGSPVTNELWTTGLTEGHWCVQLTIKDGGSNDADGLANGMVVDPGGVSITLGQNSLPVANDESYTVKKDQSLTLDVLQNDTDQEGSVHLISAFASQGEVSLQADSQSLWFTPPVNQIGIVTITYSIQDIDGATASAVSTINIVDTTDVELGTASSGGTLGLGVLTLLGLGGILRRRTLSFNDQLQRDVA